MIVGRVVGQLVSTLKHPHLEGARLLVVEPEALTGAKAPAPLLAVDRIGVDVGERVLLVDDGAAARTLTGRVGPLRALIVGVVDAAGPGPEGD